MSTRAFNLLPLTRPKGRVAVQFSDPSPCPGYKDRAEDMLVALGAKHSRRGYHLSPARAEAFSLLYKAGWHGWKDPFNNNPAQFSFNGGPNMPLTEALKLVKLGQAK